MYLFFLLFAVAGNLAHAQLLDVKNYSDKSGLPGNNITTIHQTKDGLIWLGIEGEGLVKFNGRYSEQITISNGLKDDTVTHIHEDLDESLWVATKTGGLAKVSGTTVTYPFDTLAREGFRVASIFESENSDLWIGTEKNGLFKKGQVQLTQHFPFSNEQPSPITAIWQNEFGLWVFSNQGIRILNPDDGTLVKEVDGFSGHNFFQVSPSANNSAWVISDKGIFKPAGSEIERTEDLFGEGLGTIISINETELGNLLVLNNSDELYFYDRKTAIRLGSENNLSDNKIKGVFLDQEQRYWVLTEDSGVDLVRNPPLIRYDKRTFLPSNIVHSVFSDPNSPMVWFGTDKGLSAIKDDSVSLFSVLSTEVNIKIDDIEAFPNGDLLLLSESGKLYRYSPFEKLQLLDFNSYGQDITDTFIGEDSTIYAGTPNGLITIKDNEYKIITIDSGLTGSYVLHINQDKNGQILVATDQGLSVLRDREVVTPEILYAPDFQTQVRYVIADEQNQYWLGTIEGIIRVDPKTGETDVFDNRSGLQTVDTQSLLLTDSTLWHATSSGLHKLSFRNNKLSSMVHIAYQNDIRSMKTNHHAVAENLGTIWFGSDQGVFSYSNQFEETVSKGPRIIITDIRVDFLRDKSNQLSATIKLDDEIRNGPVERFKKEENNLTFYYEGLDYSSPEELTYKYKIENLDNNWSEPTKLNSVSFQNLKPGKYIFQVKAQNQKGLWTNETASFPFVIDTPFWNSYWFFGLMVAGFLGLVYGGERLRLQWLEKEKLKKMVDHRTEYLRATLKEKEILIQEVHHRIKNNLAVISGLMELQRGQIDDDKSSQVLLEAQMRVQSIALIHEKLYQNDTLAKIDFEKYVTDLTRIIASSYNFENKDISVHTEVDDLELNLDQSIPCGLIMNELVSNAFEHAFKGKEQGNICIKFKQKENDEIEFVIQDDGIGMPEEDPMETGSLGLTLVQTLVSQLEGTLETISENGSLFKITFKKEKTGL
ncbi:MAG: histidine kinase dimerization/phosphoacceptor domain -containing protein [Gracilimonas sp.]